MVAACRTGSNALECSWGPPVPRVARGRELVSTATRGRAIWLGLLTLFSWNRVFLGKRKLYVYDAQVTINGLSRSSILNALHLYESNLTFVPRLDRNN